MIPNDHALILFKFNEKRWMEKLIQGELSFSCTGAFINQAKITGNDIQGDLHEGVFARLKKEDDRIAQMRLLLGRDLEEIDDEPYVLLRRRSSRLKPIFCFYAYTAGDALKDGIDLHVGINTITHKFDSKMYTGFSDSLKAASIISDPRRFTMVYIQPKPFMERIQNTLEEQGLLFTSKSVDYECFKSDTFFIEPTESYDELFYKFPSYQYQHEGRICITDIKFSNIFERYTLNITPLPAADYYMLHDEIYFEMKVNIDKQK